MKTRKGRRGAEGPRRDSRRRMTGTERCTPGSDKGRMAGTVLEDGKAQMKVLRVHGQMRYSITRKRRHFSYSGESMERA